MKKIYSFLRRKPIAFAVKAKRVLTDRSGQGTLDTAISILIAVVLGALLLAGLYGLSGKLQPGDIVSVIAPDYKKQGSTVLHSASRLSRI
jgi:hypothetical protein